MANGDDIHELLGVVDSIEDAKVSHTDPPEVGRSLKLSAAIRSRSQCESLYSPEDARDERLPQTLELLSRRSSKDNAVFIHALGVRCAPRASA